MARIPGEAPKVYRLNIIEEHITAAIQMMTLGCNPYSVHLLVKACSELVHNMADYRGVVLEGDFRDLIKPEYLPSYIRLANKAYNYFKHADRDPAAPYDGPSPADLQVVNEMLLTHNIYGYWKMQGTVPPALLDFTVMMMAKYPNYLKKEAFEEYPNIRAQLRELKPDADVIRSVMRTRLEEHGLWPKMDEM